MTMGAERIEIVSHSKVHAVTFAGESQVVGGYGNGDICVWKVEDGQQQGPTMRASSRIYSIVVSQDGRWIVSGDQGKRAIVWDAVTHETVLEITEPDGHVRAVDISSDCTRIASADGETVRIFSTISGIRLLPPLRHSSVVGVKFSPDGSRFATASRSRGFRVYTHNGNILFDSGLKGSSGLFPITPLAWSSDGQRLYVAAGGKVACFDLSNSSYSEWSIHQAQSRASIVSNGRFIACPASSSVSLWDCVSHEQIGSINTHTTEIKCVALSPSGGYLACGSGRNITIHNLRDVLPPEYFDHGSRRQLLASQFPPIHVSDATLESWTRDDPTDTETLLSEEITNTSNPNHYVLADRALIRTRVKRLALATEDVKESLQIQPSAIAYIAMAVALLVQGDQEGALRTFDLAFHDCELRGNRFLLLLKSILVFESGNREEAITRVEHLATRTNNDTDDDATYLYNQARPSGDTDTSLELSPTDRHYPPLKTISLIFGWNFDGLDIIAQQRLCETLCAEGRIAEAMEILLNIISTSEGEIQRSKETMDWVTDFTKRRASILEHVSDEVFELKRDDAITQSTTALPFSPAGLLVKRSRARAAKGLWEDALQDANQAVRVDPSNPCGREAKHVALHGAKRYDEAIDAFESMLHVIEQSSDPVIRQLRGNYISPSETIAAIDSIVRGVLKSCPLVVIDVTTGYLCDGPERMHIFKADPSFKELVSSMTREVDNKRILRVVTSFFGYVMFSHAWQGNEPLFQDVNAVKSVWNLPDTPLNEKLRNFCKEARRLGHNWAWSDTCCIDKANNSVLTRSLTSMYKWYADSAATLVFLAGVAHPSKPGELMRSLWMTRAWTLKEFLAPKVIFFYDSQWKPYLGDTGANHKKSPEIIQELADAIKIPRGTIVMFSPDDLGVREKLRLASTRNATAEEDVAYSLIGIFNSDIRPHYGEGSDALGHLLEEIVARSGEATVLAWSGKSSSYNSCLPASISVYSQTSYNPPSLEGEDMETCIAELRSKLPQQVALDICHRINFLPPARFATRRLHLPCIVFSVRRLGIQQLRRGNEKLYRARVNWSLPIRGFVISEVRVAELPREVVTRSLILTLTDLDSDYNAGSDEVAPSSPLHAVPAPQVDDYTQALQMIARLGQPFNALLFVQQPNGEYRRVATENEIIVSGLGTDITSKIIQVKVLEIL
ncbi:hypothetical protein EDC04DRAFT_3145675 [Pisolithus marmoratus]|nr:hypothetical protein EDC04DRAFT_3145675 [Pisolithus marmoratus]